MMNHNVTQGAGGPLARIGRRVAAIVAECNYAATRVTILRNTPSLFCPAPAPGIGPGLGSGSRAPLLHEPAWFLQRFSDLADGPACSVWPAAGSVLLTKKLIIAG
jgi:hypothetical protein